MQVFPRAVRNRVLLFHSKVAHLTAQFGFMGHKHRTCPRWVLMVVAILSLREISAVPPDQIHNLPMLSLFLSAASVFSLDYVDPEVIFTFF